jgi:membrane protein
MRTMYSDRKTLSLQSAKGLSFGIRNVVELFKSASADWSEDKATRLAAALAYYSIISMAPLLIVLLGIVGAVFGREAATGQIAGQIQTLVGEQSAQAIQDIISNASNPTTGLLSAIVGTIILLLGASGVFGALQDGLNTVWEVQAKPKRGIIGLIKDRFLSLAMVLGVGFLLLVSLVISAALSALGKYFGGVLPLDSTVLQVANSIVSFGVITFLFALIFKILPDVEITWNDVWIGAGITALLFTIGKLLIGLYLGRSTVGTAYGAAGSLVVILIWIYYSSQILFFGAEVTQVYANKYGSRLKAAANAEPINEPGPA